MKIAILGAGATGGFLALALSEAGHEVTVLARGPHLAAIRAKGLRVRDTTEREASVRLHATDDPAAIGVQEVLLSTLKAPALPGVLGALPPGLLQSARLVTAMNGVFWWYADGLAPEIARPDTRRLDHDGRLAAACAGIRPIGAVIHSTNQVIEPGLVINRSAANHFFIGAAHPESLEFLATALTCRRATFIPVADIRRNMWHKLLRNLSSAPLSVLTGGTVRQINADGDLRTIARAVFVEAALVAAAHGYAGLGQDVDDVIADGMGAEQRPSMRQDLDLGRPMELDTILRIVLDFARQANVPVPVLETLVAMVVGKARLAGCA